MFRRLFIVHESGTPVYTYPTEDISEEKQLLLSGFLSAISSFVGQRSLLPEEDGTINSVKLSEGMLTFRSLTLMSDKGGSIRYYFVLMTDMDERRQSEVKSILEYVTLSFLSYKGGEFRRKMRETGYSCPEFKAFDELMERIADLDWNRIRKKIKPDPGSLVQGLLNELRDYAPFEQILQLHPKIVPVGSSYALLSDDLSPEEEKEVLGKIEQMITRMFGRGLFGSLVADVRKQLSERLSGREYQ